MLLNLLFKSFLIFLPAAIANMVPIFSSRITYLKKFKQPIDAGKLFRSKPILGSNKTWRGLFSGLLAGSILSCLFYWSIPYYANFFDSINQAFLFGLISSFGALSGDAFESFIKRQFNKKPGEPWFPFDQIDYTLGMLLFTFFYIELSAIFWIETIILWGSLSLLTSYIGYFLKIKETPL